MKKILFILLFGSLCLFTSCNNDHSFEEKTYTLSSSESVFIEELSVDCFDREIILEGNDEETISVTYFEDDQETYAFTIEDQNLSIVLSQHKNWYDFIGVKADRQYRTVTISLPDRLFKTLKIETTNENLTVSSLKAKTVELINNGGNILLHDLKADYLSATIKNGHITGNIQGSWDQYEIFCTVKKGNSNLPEYKSGGPNQMKIEANNGDIDLTIEP